LRAVLARMGLPAAAACALLAACGGAWAAAETPAVPPVPPVPPVHSAPRTIVRELSRGESIHLALPETRHPAAMRLVLGSSSVTFRLNSDGLLTIIDVTGSVDVAIRAEGTEVRTRLSRGQSVTAWVLSSMTASADEGLSLGLRMSSWTFALRADRAGPLGVVLTTNAGTGTLYDGQRVDLVESPTGERTLARSGVRLPALSILRGRRSGGEGAEGAVGAGGAGEAGDEPELSGLPPYPPAKRYLSGTAGISGATIALPGPPPEVMRPDFVSP